MKTGARKVVAGRPSPLPIPKFQTSEILLILFASLTIATIFVNISSTKTLNKKLYAGINTPTFPWCLVLFLCKIWKWDSITVIRITSFYIFSISNAISIQHFSTLLALCVIVSFCGDGLEGLFLIFFLFSFICFLK